MKYSLGVILLLIPFFSPAQECGLTRDTDPYTKETKISTGFISLQGGSLSVDADSKEIDFFFIVDGKCFDDASTVFIYFEGSKVKTTYRNAGGMNCNGYFHFKYRNNTVIPTVMKKLATQKTAQFIFTANDKKQTIISLLPDQQEVLMKAVACMSEEAQTLIK
jgi:hypothetical protein